jgi:hypothetical protein
MNFTEISTTPHLPSFGNSDLPCDMISHHHHSTLFACRTRAPMRSGCTSRTWSSPTWYTSCTPMALLYTGRGMGGGGAGGHSAGVQRCCVHVRHVCIGTCRDSSAEITPALRWLTTWTFSAGLLSGCALLLMLRTGHSSLLCPGGPLLTWGSWTDSR